MYIMSSLAVIHLPILVLLIGTALSLEHYKQEAHTIMKRMANADENFEDSDVARVHLVKGTNRRRLARRDLNAVLNSDTGQMTRALQLELSSGSKIDLAIRPSGLVGENTIVSYQTASGRSEGKRGLVDCYYVGQVNDPSGNGWASVSHCDGLFGFAQSPGYHYFLHPVENRQRSKRDAGENEDYDVHVMWRRAQPMEGVKVDNDSMAGNLINAYDDNLYVQRSTQEGRSNATEFVIEMALFSDAEYWEGLQELYPGREDDFMLVRLAGTQALFGDREKVGYDVRIKVKHLEYWITNPDEYTFTQHLVTNMQSFCSITSNRYAYDLLALNTGITAWNDGVIGFAYSASTCTNKRCLVLKSLSLASFAGFAHEIGHTLGLKHEAISSCPEEMKTGGFMGGGNPYDFTPCMRQELETFLQDEKSQCLFEETALTHTSSQFLNTPNVLPGQSKTADGLCQLLGGPGYNFGPSENPYGSFICKWFLCLNENATNPEFGRTKKFTAPVGFPCASQSFCNKLKRCQPLSQANLEVQMASLNNLNRKPTWSEWSADVSGCSRSCGTGIRTRRRKCLYFDFNSEPYCLGQPVKPELCNTEPCVGEPNDNTLRMLWGNEVCAVFLNGNVTLKLKGANNYLPFAEKVKILEVGQPFSSVHGKSCYISCQRSPIGSAGDIDAVLPDGTPCLDTKRSYYDMAQLSIQLKCLRGICHEFSNCPDPLQEKDRCGICGGDSSRCVALTFNSLSYVPRRNRVRLTEIPAGSENIDVNIDKRINFGVVLELWSKDSKNIIGEGGLYSRRNKYEGNNTVSFAGTQWTYLLTAGYFRARGPIQEPVVVQAMRLGRPIKKVTVKYAKGAPQT